MAERQRGVHPHFFGVTMLNLGLSRSIQDRPVEALRLSWKRPLEALEPTSAANRDSSRSCLGPTVLAQLGRLTERRRLVNDHTRVDLNLRTRSATCTGSSRVLRIHTGTRTERQALLEEADALPGSSQTPVDAGSGRGEVLDQAKRFDEASHARREHAGGTRRVSGSAVAASSTVAYSSGVVATLERGAASMHGSAQGSGRIAGDAIADLLLAFSRRRR